MQTPLQITFHQMDPSQALEDDIRQRAGELEKVFAGVVSGRVLVEAPHRHHHRGQLYRIRIELLVPGDHLVVGRSPDQDGTHEDVYVAVHDAFRAARRQLEAYARRQRGEVKTHANGPS
jgi:ribosome-associated translation inhibitor RaiA